MAERRRGRGGASGSPAAVRRGGGEEAAEPVCPLGNEQPGGGERTESRFVRLRNRPPGAAPCCSAGLSWCRCRCLGLRDEGSPWKRSGGVLSTSGNSTVSAF